MKRHILLLIMMALNISFVEVLAKPAKAECDSLYSSHLYDEALKGYLALAELQPQNPDLLYNIGNCYYRLKEIPKAIVYYERASRINPSDTDIRHNLTLARAQTEDKFYSASDLDVVYSFNSFINTFDTDGWAWLSVVAVVILLCSITIVRFCTAKGVRRTAYGGIVVSICGIIVFNIFALVQRNKYNNHSQAIVMATTKLMSTPDTTGTRLFTLHGGTKIELTDTTLSAWSEVSLPDGQEGWVKNSDIEQI